MVHGHPHRAMHLKHAGRRVELPRQDNPIQDFVETVVQIVFETAPPAPENPPQQTQVNGNPVQQTKAPQPEPTKQDPAPAPAEEQPEQSSQPTAIPAPASSVKPTVTSLLMDQPKETALPSSAVSAPPTSKATSAPSNAGGMSSGGTAGLVIGILLMVGVALALILFFIKKKKKAAQKERQPIDGDDEKNDFFVPAAAAAAPSNQNNPTARTHAIAPRLSLRPVTEFDPALEEKRRSAGNMLEKASAPTAGGMLAPTAQPAVSAWERRGAEKHQQENPFSDPVNPFGNNAGSPTSPTAMSPSLASNNSNTLVEDSSMAVVGGVAVAGVAAAAAASQRKPLPYPSDTDRKSEVMNEKATPGQGPQPQGNGPEQRSLSPAWVDDVPASPGPAPTGPPPIAAANGPAGPDNVHRVQLDFKPSMDDELEIRAGQLVRMLHEYDDGWALCVRMDRSQQGVAPRSCLSKMPVKPRQGPPPQQRRPGPPGPPGPPRGPMGPGVPRPLTPNSGRNSPAHGRNSPGPVYHPQSPAGRPRANSNANGPQMRQNPDARSRSNSSGPGNARRQSPPASSPLNPTPQSPERKPVPGQAL